MGVYNQLINNNSINSAYVSVIYTSQPINADNFYTQKVIKNEH